MMQDDADILMSSIGECTVGTARTANSPRLTAPTSDDNEDGVMSLKEITLHVDVLAEYYKTQQESRKLHQHQHNEL